MIYLIYLKNSTSPGGRVVCVYELDITFSNRKSEVKVTPKGQNTFILYRSTHRDKTKHSMDCKKVFCSLGWPAFFLSSYLLLIVPLPFLSHIQSWWGFCSPTALHIPGGTTSLPSLMHMFGCPEDLQKPAHHAPSI